MCRPSLGKSHQRACQAHPGGCVCQEKVILHGAPHQAEEFVSVGSTEACWSGGFAFSGRPVSLITGPGPLGSWHPVFPAKCSPGNVCSWLA